MADLWMSAVLVTVAVWTTARAVHTGGTMIEGARTHLADAGLE